VKKWLSDFIQAEGYKIDHISYIFCSDKYLFELNQKYLDHDTYTDIITFDYSERKGFIYGEIYISIQRVKANAKKFEITFLHELHRVMIHGVLHLCGYKDKTSLQKSQMRAKEDKYLELIVIE
jgi:rRNA maturation RNase YbeY